MPPIGNQSLAEDQTVTDKIDDVSAVSVTVMRGNPGWLTGISGSDGGNVGTYELADLPQARSLVEAENSVTAWLAGRGFTLSSSWRTVEYNGSEDRATQTEAEFVRK